MDLLPALLKHLALSRSVVGAVFVTSAVLLFAPRIAPQLVEPVPKEWASVVVGALAFSAFLLVFWACSAVWSAARRRMKANSALFASYLLDQTEQEFLLAIAERPTEPLNLDHVDYEGVAMSRLEVMQLVEGLASKGLLSFNRFSPQLVVLTSLGRERTLEIQRRSRPNAT